MKQAEINLVIEEVKTTYKKISRHSQKAELDDFLSYYDDSSDFLSISADGKMSNYEEFSQACAGYYGSLLQQEISTTREHVHVIDTGLVIMGWTGDITATFRNGDIIKMKDYSITSVFRKTDGNWKVIHDHESALPPAIIKKNGA